MRKMQARNLFSRKEYNAPEHVLNAINEAWQVIAPLWPLQSFIAKNPLSGLEGIPFENALSLANSYFQNTDIPKQLEDINIHSIKWLQAYFDNGQATIKMPFREKGLFNAWKMLAVYDKEFHKNDKKSIQFLRSLPANPDIVITLSLKKLGIDESNYTDFLRFLLTSLPGWAGYIKNQVDWQDPACPPVYPVSFNDYLAVRLVMAVVLWSDASEYKISESTQDQTNVISKITNSEQKYKDFLYPLIRQEYNITSTIPDAQFVFCIDVRSEPLRRAIESTGNYETLGYAGFFGVPVIVDKFHDKQKSANCPVLLAPKHNIKEIPVCSQGRFLRDKWGKKCLDTFKAFYQALKYAFTAPFALVEALGGWFGIYSFFKTLFPLQTSKFINKFILNIRPDINTVPSLYTLQDNKREIYGISLTEQCAYAENFLKQTGFTKNFAKFVFLCGHGSKSQNNPYSASLDCGACGGHSGGINAKVLAAILNEAKVREYLKSQDICIPDDTHFIAAEHNTTTDDIQIYKNYPNEVSENIRNINHDLSKAKYLNNIWRASSMGLNADKIDVNNAITTKSVNWAETRPEWGLAGNSSIIIAPRHFTKNINLLGKSFLHSYNSEIDEDGSLLEKILTAPVIVAKWINLQYLFASLDNVAYGGGSKITQNITSKIGIMQGNASDLMHGPALQSIYLDDDTAYHEPVRLLVVIYAQNGVISDVIGRQEVLQQLVNGGWINLTSVDPISNNIYEMQRDFSWIRFS